MSYDRLAPTISSKAKKLFGSGNMGQNNWGGGSPFSDGLDTRPCKILDPRLGRAESRGPRLPVSSEREEGREAKYVKG